MHRYFSCLVLGAILSTNNAASAESVSKTREISIMGPVKCEEWLKAANASQSADDSISSTITNFFPKAIQQRWALGLITGLNAASDAETDVIASIDSQLVFDWTDKYCKENQTKSVYDAVNALFIQLLKASHKRKSK